MHIGGGGGTTGNAAHHGGPIAMHENGRCRRVGIHTWLIDSQ